MNAAPGGGPFYSRHAPDGTYLEVSGPVEELVGFAPEQLVGTPAYAYYHPADAAVVSSSHARALSSPDTTTATYRFRHRDGHYVPVTTTSYQHRDAVTGEVTAIVAVTSPGESDASAEEPREPSERLARMVDGSPDLVLLVAPESGLVTYANSAVERSVGAAPGSLAGSSFFALLDPADMPKVVAAMGRLLHRPGAGLPLRFRLASSRGGRPLAAVVVNLVDDPEVGAVLVNAHDAADATTRGRTGAPAGPAVGASAEQAFFDHVLRALQAAGRPGAVCVVHVVIDRLEMVADAFGPAHVDRLVSLVTERLRATLDATDTAVEIGRLAGSAVGLVCPGVEGTEDASALADRLSAAIETMPFEVDGSEIVLRASIGVAVGDADSAPDILVAQSVSAAARARRAARPVVFDESFRAHAVNALRVGGELRGAIDRGELRAHYQPYVFVRDGAVAGVEALVRWEHPDRGLVPPGEFVPVAEDNGFINAIGGWMLRRACQDLARWSSEGAGALTVSVNVSPRQFVEEDFVDVVLDAASIAGIDPAAICLEITESALMTDPDAARDALTALAEHGVRCAIDDFGVGHSSLGYLKRFPVDFVKIDRSFVAGLGVDDGDTAIVAAVIAMAHSLGLEVVAEGVEREEQLAGLRALRCDYAQGFHLAVPQPADQVSELLRTSVTADER